MLVGELKSLEQSERLVHRASNRQVIDSDLPERSVGVDQEEASEGDALVRLEDAVAARDVVRLVGQQGDVHFAEAALLAWRVDPGEVAELAVGGDGDQLAAKRSELLGSVRE